MIFSLIFKSIVVIVGITMLIFIIHFLFGIGAIMVFPQPVISIFSVPFIAQSPLAAEATPDDEGPSDGVRTDAYIISAYYYPTSKSLGENAIGMVLLMNRFTQKNMTHYKINLVASNAYNQTVVTNPVMLEESYSYCDYINMVATGNVVPNMTKLEISDGNTKMEIPFKMARTTAPASVVICMSPQFAAEQWQLFVAHAHVAKHFGAHIHLYITSLLDSFHHLAIEYEKLGYVTLDYWLRLKFANASADAIEPNLNSELRNQAGAESDCLLQYKEAAAFIMFFDLDDILIPRAFTNYFDEITEMYRRHPNTQTFQVSKRELLTYNKPTIDDIDIGEMLGHVWFVNEDDYGKIIADPNKLNSMWIHQSWNVKNNYASKTNYIIHIQKPVDSDGHDPVPYRRSNFDEMESMRLNSSIFAPIQQDLERLLNTTTIRQLAEKCPKQTFYFPIVYRCYYEKFYRRPKKESCPNGEGCQMPQRSDLNCIHADADFKSGPPMVPITYHYHVNTRWTPQKGCHI